LITAVNNKIAKSNLYKIVESNNLRCFLLSFILTIPKNMPEKEHFPLSENSKLLPETWSKTEFL